MDQLNAKRASRWLTGTTGIADSGIDVRLMTFKVPYNNDVVVDLSLDKATFTFPVEVVLLVAFKPAVIENNDKMIETLQHDCYLSLFNLTKLMNRSKTRIIRNDFGHSHKTNFNQQHAVSKL